MSALTIAVHGINGVQGGGVARRLEAAGHRVVAVPRDLSYRGADAAVVSLPLLFDARAVQLADRIVAALRRDGVRRVVFNTGGGLPVPEPVGVPFLDARYRIAQIATAVVGPAATYLENLSSPWSARHITEDGVIAYPVPEAAPLPWVALDDVANVIETALTADDPVATQLVAGAPLAGSSLASEIASAIGRAVIYEEISPDAYRAQLAAHVGDHAAHGIAALYAAGGPAAPPSEVIVTGPTSASDWARAALAPTAAR